MLLLEFTARMNTCYKIFHIPTHIKRSGLVKKADTYLKQFFTRLNTPTIKISNKKEYHKFYDKNKSILICPDGYCPDNPTDFSEGWKYGELGIWASHYTAWKNFFNTKFDCLLLIEDDVILNCDFHNLFISYVKELPDDWEILSLHAPSGVTKYHVMFDIQREHTCRSYQDWSAACYVISRCGANNLIKNSTIVRYPLDWFMFRQSFNAYTYKPTSEPPIFLVNMESSIKKQKRIILC